MDKFMEQTQQKKMWRVPFERAHGAIAAASFELVVGAVDALEAANKAWDNLRAMVGTAGLTRYKIKDGPRKSPYIDAKGDRITPDPDPAIEEL